MEQFSQTAEMEAASASYLECAGTTIAQEYVGAYEVAVASHRR